MKVLDLKGYKSLKAFNAFHTLMLGLKMLPSYQMESYEDFLFKVDRMPEEDQEKCIREAAMFVTLQQEELEAILCFCTDKNGVPYGSANLKNLNPRELIDCIVAVSMEISKIPTGLIPENEKKNLKTSPLISDASLQETPASH